MAQLNINKLYETARKKELSKYENFDKILTRCHNKITHYAENKKTECLYNIPEFIIGTPLFDRTELQEYILSSLIKNGFLVTKYPGFNIYISWDIKNKQKKKQSMKKRDTTEYRFIEDYKPSGAFTINENALNELKEKSIKMLNI